MSPNIKYITQVSSRDLREMADAANAHGGDGINVDRTTEGLEISIDKAQLMRWIRVVVGGGRLQ